MKLREINSKAGPKPMGQYNQAIEISEATRTLYISGQLGTHLDGSLPETMHEQAVLVWKNLRAQLKEAGMDFSNLVKITTIIPNSAEIPDSRKARSEALGEHKPASTLIVAGLADPKFKIEIEGIACK